MKRESGSESGDLSGKIAELYRQYWYELCAWLYAQFGAGPPEPEDVAQQTFAKFADLEDSGQIDNPKAFLMRMAHNIVISEKRRMQTRQKHASTSFLLQEGDDLTLERVFIAKEQVSVVTETIARMPHKRRRMLLLNRIHGLSYADIARRFGVSATSVKKHVARAIADLDTALCQEQNDEGKNL